MVVSTFLLVGLFGGLIVYKARGGLKRIYDLRATGLVRIHPEALHRPAGSELAATGAQTLAYLNIVWPALLFGVLISAAVHAAISPGSWQCCSGKERSNRNLPQQLRALP